jgi:DNA-binding transcriptional LysR family regulator
VPQPPHAASFRLVVVPGVTVGNWAAMWAERLPGIELQVVAVEATRAAARVGADAGAGLLRLPVNPAAFHAIPLYTESTVVAVPRDHLLTAAAEVTLADLAGEPLLQPADDVLAWPATPPTAGPEPAEQAGSPTVGAERAAGMVAPPTTAAAVEMVAAGAGVLVVPQSLARLHHRRDLAYRPVTDAPTSSVGLVWRRDGYTELVEQMIGIVRGRTVNSTRGTTPPPTAGTKAGTKATRHGRTPPRHHGRPR